MGVEAPSQGGSREIRIRCEMWAHVSRGGMCDETEMALDGHGGEVEKRWAQTALEVFWKSVGEAVRWRARSGSRARARRGGNHSSTCQFLLG